MEYNDDYDNSSISSDDDSDTEELNVDNPLHVQAHGQIIAPGYDNNHHHNNNGFGIGLAAILLHAVGQPQGTLITEDNHPQANNQQPTAAPLNALGLYNWLSGFLPNTTFNNTIVSQVFNNFINNGHT